MDVRSTFGLFVDNDGERATHVRAPRPPNLVRGYRREDVLHMLLSELEAYLTLDLWLESVKALPFVLLSHYEEGSAVLRVVRSTRTSTSPAMQCTTEEVGSDFFSRLVKATQYPLDPAARQARTPSSNADWLPFDHFTVTCLQRTVEDFFLYELPLGLEKLAEAQRHQPPEHAWCPRTYNYDEMHSLPSTTASSLASPIKPLSPKRERKRQRGRGDDGEHGKVVSQSAASEKRRKREHSAARSVHGGVAMSERAHNGPETTLDGVRSLNAIIELVTLVDAK
ncbi:hypothetical protein LTR27_011478 [Elasticomyces elasticus]|nr:hypothetical protein LTR27_011478 [Elasticomyces elasticus]